MAETPSRARGRLYSLRSRYGRESAHMGETAEGFKVHAWKAGVWLKPYRRFESLSLRHQPSGYCWTASLHHSSADISEMQSNSRSSATSNIIQNRIFQFAQRSLPDSGPVSASSALEALETPPRAWGRLACSSISIMISGNTPTGVGKTRASTSVFE